MAIVSRQEFADLCGDDVKYLNVYISRKKVVLFDDSGKTLDTKNGINAAFIKRRKEFNAVKKDEKQIIASIPVNPHKVKVPAPAKDEDEGEEVPLDPKMEEAVKSGSLNSVFGRYTAAEYMFMQLRGNAELALTRAEKEKMQLEKAKGELLPIILVTEVYKRYSNNIFNHFESGIEIIADKFCQIMAGGNRDLHTRALEECRHVLKRCIQDAGMETNEDIERLVTEFSISRARGEKKI
jgi:hypothetical protein